MSPPTSMLTVPTLESAIPSETWKVKRSLPDTLLSGEGFAEAMRTYAETLKFTQNGDGLPRSAGEHASDGVSLMGSVLPNQVSGRCALIYDWMASGTSSVLDGPYFGRSYVNNQVRSTLVREGAHAALRFSFILQTHSIA